MRSHACRLGLGLVPNAQLLENGVICVLPSLCGRWCPPGVPDSPFRHCSDPGLGCPASPGRCRAVLGVAAGGDVFSSPVGQCCPRYWSFGDLGARVGQVLGSRRAGEAVGAPRPWVEEVFALLGQAPRRDTATLAAGTPGLRACCPPVLAPPFSL